MFKLLAKLPPLWWVLAAGCGLLSFLAGQRLVDLAWLVRYGR